jgi:hypothetical protein
MKRFIQRFSVFGATGYIGSDAPPTFRKGERIMSTKVLLPPQVNDSDDSREYAADDTIVWDGFERRYEDDPILLPAEVAAMNVRKPNLKTMQRDADRRGVLLPTEFNRGSAAFRVAATTHRTVEPLLPLGVR